MKGQTKNEFITPMGEKLLKVLESTYADKYISEYLFPQFEKKIGTSITSRQELQKFLKDTKVSLKCLVAYYIISRKSRDKKVFSNILLESIDKTLFEEGDWISSEKSQKFLNTVREFAQTHKQLRVFDTIKPLLDGLIYLISDIYENYGYGNIFLWIKSEVEETNSLEYVYHRLTSIKALGPKTASLILRDTAYIYDLENDLEFSDRIYLQPITSTLRIVASHAICEAQEKGFADWILAGKIAKAARMCNLSGIRINMGCNYIGLKSVQESVRIENLLNSIIRSS